MSYGNMRKSIFFIVSIHIATKFVLWSIPVPTSMLPPSILYSQSVKISSQIYYGYNSALMALSIKIWSLYPSRYNNLPNVFLVHLICEQSETVQLDGSSIPLSTDKIFADRSEKKVLQSQVHYGGWKMCASSRWLTTHFLLMDGCSWEWNIVKHAKSMHIISNSVAKQPAHHSHAVDTHETKPWTNFAVLLATFRYCVEVIYQLCNVIRVRLMCKITVK